MIYSFTSRPFCRRTLSLYCTCAWHWFQNCLDFPIHFTIVTQKKKKGQRNEGFMQHAMENEINTWVRTNEFTCPMANWWCKCIKEETLPQKKRHSLFNLLMRRTQKIKLTVICWDFNFLLLAVITTRFLRPGSSLGMSVEFEPLCTVSSKR